MGKKTSFGIWTFVIGGLVGGAVGYMGREEIKRMMDMFKGGGGGGDTAARARRIRMAQRARLRQMGYAV